ncbi:hypothetical protein [Winogradskyella sp. 3972H.M.0a.05]|uniref:hypothetical protein n=1 Tax=Winogradskyella sp. 3972H.M.0a.05 TaxID=2950277 RepID=UPI00339AE266
MIKKTLLLSLACLTFLSGFAQEFKTEKSSYFTKESEKDIYKIVFPSAYGFMTLHHLDNVFMDIKKTMVLTKYDQEMNSIESMSFNLPKLNLRPSDLLDVIELEGQLIFLSNVMDKKSGVNQINAQVYSQKENTVGDHITLSSFPIEKYSKSGFYDIAISPDQSKIAIVANMPFVKKTKEKVKVWVYDNQLNLLWEQSETLSYPSERAYQEEVFVQNSGVVVMSKVIDAYKKSRKTQLLSFNGNSVEDQTFSSAGFLPMEMTLIDVNGKSMLTGFFWNGKKAIIKINSKEGNDNDGAFLYDLDSNNLIGIHEWSESLKSDDLKSLHVVDAKVVNDDIYIIGEKQLKKSEFRKTGGTTSTEMDYFYTYGSSVIVNMDTKGTLKSFTPLFSSKQYKNYEKEKGSMTALFLENGLRVFHNNNSHLALSTYFTENPGKFYPTRVIPYEHGQAKLPYILPQTVREVKNYGMVYYMTKARDRYWFNKMTW